MTSPNQTFLTDFKSGNLFNFYSIWDKYELRLKLVPKVTIVKSNLFYSKVTIIVSLFNDDKCVIYVLIERIV